MDEDEQVIQAVHDIVEYLDEEALYRIYRCVKGVGQWEVLDMFWKGTDEPTSMISGFVSSYFYAKIWAATHPEESIPF